MLAIKAIAICYKPYLKPEEAMIYCNLQHTALAERLQALAIYKNESGYYKRADLDLMMSGTTDRIPLPSQNVGGCPISKKAG